MKPPVSFLLFKHAGEWEVCEVPIPSEKFRTVVQEGINEHQFFCTKPIEQMFEIQMVDDRPWIATVDLKPDPNYRPKPQNSTPVVEVAPGIMVVGPVSGAELLAQMSGSFFGTKKKKKYDA